jgi:hypothetical protein
LFPSATLILGLLPIQKHNNDCDIVYSTLNYRSLQKFIRCSMSQCLCFGQCTDTDLGILLRYLRSKMCEQIPRPSQHPLQNYSKKERHGTGLKCRDIKRWEHPSLLSPRLTFNTLFAHSTASSSERTSHNPSLQRSWDNIHQCDLIQGHLWNHIYSILQERFNAISVWHPRKRHKSVFKAVLNPLSISEHENKQCWVYKLLE